MVHLIVDAANVVGSRPDGWWRDRPGAAAKLAAQLASVDPAALAALDPAHAGAAVTVHLVLEGAAKDARDLPSGIDVVLATADGDSAIADLAADLQREPVVVVTADQGLRRRVQRVGATVVGPRALRAVLPEP
jgi:hypothetical protein